MPSSATPSPLDQLAGIEQMLRTDAESSRDNGFPVSAGHYDRAAATLATLREVFTLRPESEWHEDDGNVLWWYIAPNGYPCEPPYAGTPLDDDFPNYVTHWTKLPDVRLTPDSPRQAGEEITDG